MDVGLSEDFIERGWGEANVDILSLEWECVIEFNYSRLVQYEILKKPVTFIIC